VEHLSTFGSNTGTAAVCATLSIMLGMPRTWAVGRRVLSAATRTYLLAAKSRHPGGQKRVTRSFRSANQATAL
jgi:hypothetical protein